MFPVSCAYSTAFAASILCFRYRPNKESSIVCMPIFLLVCMMDGIWCALSSRIRFLIAGVPSMTSNAATRDFPSIVGRSCWEITASRTDASCERIWFCWCGGNTSTIRSMVGAAPMVCRVENTRCPVSAAVMAVEIVSSHASPPQE